MNHRSIFTATITLLAATFAVMPAYAHHSGAMYDSTKIVTIEGTVKEFDWTNPHVILWVVANPVAGQPEQTWALESTSPGNLTRAGWTKHSFNVGDRVRVDFHPLRSGEPGGNFAHAVLTDTGKEVGVPTRPTDVGGQPNIK